MPLIKNSSHFGTNQISILTLVFCFTIFQTAFSQNKIIFPWRAAPHIVKQGNTFELLLKHDGSVPIDSKGLWGGPQERNNANGCWNCTKNFVLWSNSCWKFMNLFRVLLARKNVKIWRIGRPKGGSS